MVTFIILKNKYAQKISDAENGTKDHTYPPQPNKNKITGTEIGDNDRSQGQLDSVKVSEIETGFEDPTKAQLTSTDKEDAE